MIRPLRFAIASPVPLGMVLGTLLCVGVGVGVAAAPPEWAAAHGRRDGLPRQQDRHEQRDAERGRARTVVLEPRYGVLHGHCNRQALGTVLGALAGGVVGHQVGDGDEGAMAVGLLLGALLGNASGGAFDQADRACTREALQYAQNGRPVQWLNGATTYIVTPGALVSGNGHHCRPFTLVAERDGRRWQEQRRACRGQDRNWYVDN